MLLPDHLVSTFKLLEREGFRIAQRKPGTKRSIKFEDVARSLVMDIKLPGSAWVQITPDQVAKATSGRRSEPVPAVSEVLAISSMDLPVVQNAPADYDEEMEPEDEINNQANQ